MPLNYKRVFAENDIKPNIGNGVFVFGSNKKGNHLGGAAAYAVSNFGAKEGIGVGLIGNSYAIPTIDEDMSVMTIPEIKQFVVDFIQLALSHKDRMFHVTKIGCGIAGYSPVEIAPLFRSAIKAENILLPQEFVSILEPTKIRAYKVTDKNMKCRGYQYELGKRHNFKGDILICNKGFHSCINPSNCWSYYDHTPDTRMFLCEIEVDQTIQHEGGEDVFTSEKICSNNITFIEEVTHRISELCNTGDRNTGDRNTGNRNTGDRNTGDRNTGNRNTGNRNTGDRNTGNRNTGNWNTGNWNTGDRNTGHFNTKNPPIIMFNLPTDKQESQIYFPSWLYFNLTTWRYSSEMTNLEKENHPEHEICGGYLLVTPFKAAAQESWDNSTTEQRRMTFDLPNFNADILYEIFGIDVRGKKREDVE